MSNIKLYNVNGQLVYSSGTKYTTVNKVEVPLKVASGAYIIQCTYDSNKQLTRKIIID